MIMNLGMSAVFTINKTQRVVNTHQKDKCQYN